MPPLTDEAQAALDLLRQCMEENGQAAAVAYLGFREENERGGELSDWLWTNDPGLMEEMAFLQSIPDERVLNGDCGDLYCIVPRDENTSLAVNHVAWRGDKAEPDEVLYRSENAEPLLVFVRWEQTPDKPDVEINAVAADAEVTWYPTRNEEDGGYIEIPTGEDGWTLLLDFGSFGDVTGVDYAGAEWFPPTDLGLADSIWNYGNWMLELHDGGGDPAYAGTAELSYQPADGQAYRVACSGVWRMQNDCLNLELSSEIKPMVSGSFPVVIDLTGEHLLLQKDWDSYTGIPFLTDGAASVELTRSYG